MSDFPLQQRLAGVLLHPTSLPSGRLGDASAWLDFMAAAGLRVWQVLPLGVPHSDHSPYQCLSAFALNPALLEERHLPAPQPDDEAFRLWCGRQAHWLDDFALFTGIKQQQRGRAWYHWPDEYKFRHATALLQFGQEHSEQLLRIRWQQFQLYLEWQHIHRSAGQKGIYLFGDMPIYVAQDSADVWAHPERFLLDEAGAPTLVAGVPPDYFSETGQRWGNPHYDWKQMEAEGFSWWLERLHHHFELFDIVRIDHFRALEAAWMIEADCETAVDGHWEKTPGDALLQVLADEMGAIPLVAEDLGIITKEVTALRHKYHLPGMSVLQFSFDHFDDNPHKPQNILPDTVVYTGTHDNDTTHGWFNALDPQMQQHVLKVLGIEDATQVVDTLIDQALGCRANLAIIPLQDILGLNSGARMNTPGTMEHNWRWRFSWLQLSTQLSASLHTRIEAAGRI